MRPTPKDLEYLEKKDAVSKPPLCKGPIPPIGGKCHAVTKGGGRWLGDSRDGGIVVAIPSPLEDNPSVSLTADSSLCTREPLILPTFGASAPNPLALVSSGPLRGPPPPRGGYFTAAPRDCLQSRRAAKQGMSQAHSNHRRAAAGGESKHNHKSAPAPVKFPPSFPSGWLPRVRARRPGELWLLSFAGK